MGTNETMMKTYEPAAIEDRLYAAWEEKGYFHADPDPAKKPFTIVMPPPNITGQLHMGHALDCTLQDVLIRWRRMQGYTALWLPGTDHASIATEAKIVEAMNREGITKEDIGREAFLERAWAWKHHYGGRIVSQLKKLGSSCDWTRERFTLDEGLSKAVREVFVRLYRKGLIYRGERIVNRCPECRTSISDAEVEYHEEEGFLWHIRYPAEDGSEGLVVATTRPETMLGDTAVAVHPEDERYAGLVGRHLVLPLVGRRIPVIADSVVEKDFGTGAVKITPAHDPNDFETGQRHGLPLVRVIDGAGRMTEEAGIFAGLDRYEARRRVVEALSEQGVLVKTEKHVHNVGACYRCDTVIEPMVSLQWFVRMQLMAEPALEAVRDGRVRFVPDRFAKIYYNWMEHIRDWCISRQLWWGHRIPAWYCESCGETVVSAEPPARCPQCGSAKLLQDPDTLDTWFSSALWPFSTLGWPDNHPDLAYFYPTSVLVTGYDIIFFWVARMIFSGLEQTGREPFRHVLIHGMVRDAQGRKMTKSLGNGIDPLEMIRDFGTDAIRYALVTGISPGNDLRFSTEKAEAGRNFANKIWNAARFVISGLEGRERVKDQAGAGKEFHADAVTDMADRWVLDRVNRLVAEVAENLERFDMGIALQKIYEFAWDDFCDWYIEISKIRLYGEDKAAADETAAMLRRVLVILLKLLHPFMPFVTSEIFRCLPRGEGEEREEEDLMISCWPEADPAASFPAEREAMTLLMEVIRGIRNVKAERNVHPGKKAAIVAVTDDPAVSDAFRQGDGMIRRLAGVSRIALPEAGGERRIPDDAVTLVYPGVTVFIPLQELVDLDEEIVRLGREKESLEKELARVRAKLDNPGFIAKAPAEVVGAEKEKADRYADMYDGVIRRLTEMIERKKNI